MASLVNHSVNNLINGVSQQATSVRLDNQFEEQINCFSDVTKGLTIRNGLELMNVVTEDLSNRQKIEFDVDGQKYLIALDTNDVTPVVHVPLSANIAQLTASITSPEYFDNVTAADLRVLEDKDRVYILNKNKEVGTSQLSSTFFDITVLNDTTGVTDDNWDTGTYTLTIDPVADPATTTTVLAPTLNIVVTAAMEPKDVAAAINAVTATTDETGECYAVGDKGAYRLVFSSIPVNFIAPSISIAETTTIQGTVTSTDNSGWVFTSYQSYVGSRPTSPRLYYFYWEGAYIGVSTNSFLKVGDVTYYRGNFKGYTGPDWPDGIDGAHYIRREEVITNTQDYTPSITDPNTISGSEFSVDRYADAGMIWVTGVSSNQTYDVTIEYEDVTGTPQAPITLATINVGTTVSQIKLNWVAGQIVSQLHGTTTADPSNHFSAAQYDNAVYLYTTTPQAYNITSIQVTNSFDNTSLNGVIRATVDNASAIQDISNLPPLFVADFKVRVGDESGDSDNNYYLKYDVDFKGWKESGLDESRVIDQATMPYVIDKNIIRRTGVIEIGPTTWTPSRAGDELSNPVPSFVGQTIQDIFFYGSRLGIATGDTIVMSKIDAPTTFFRTTCSQTVTSDRVDIKLDSAKIGFEAINNVATLDGKLFVNTGTIQSVLQVNTAFDLTSARLAEVSSYTLGDFRPLAVNNGLYFALTNNGYTNIFNYITSGQNSYEAFNITKHIPTYINGTVKHMAYADNLTVISVEEDRSVLYIQNKYTEGGQMLQNAWHKWTLPYDLEYFYFEDNNLYVLMTGVDSNVVTKTIVTKYDLTPQVVTESTEDVYIGWTPVLDCWTKDKTLIEDFSEFKGINDRFGQAYDTVAEAYASTQYSQIDEGVLDGPYYDASAPEYYWKISGNTVNIVWNGVAIITVGNSTQEFVDYNGYRYYRGDESVDSNFYEISRTAITTTNFTEDEMVYGVPFDLSLTFSEFIPRQQTQDGFVVMNYSTLMIRRMRLLLNNSGVFSVDVSFADRNSYTINYTGQPLGKKLLGRASVSDINFNFPINGKSDKVTITISSSSSTPFNLLSAEWQGQLIMRGRNI